LGENSGLWELQLHSGHRVFGGHLKCWTQCETTAHPHIRPLWTCLFWDGVLWVTHWSHSLPRPSFVRLQAGVVRRSTNTRASWLLEPWDHPIIAKPQLAHGSLPMAWLAQDLWNPTCRRV
jgi:hypothetical protein